MLVTKNGVNFISDFCFAWRKGTKQIWNNNIESDIFYDLSGNKIYRSLRRPAWTIALTNHIFHILLYSICSWHLINWYLGLEAHKDLHLVANR